MTSKSKNLIDGFMWPPAHLNWNFNLNVVQKNLSFLPFQTKLWTQFEVQYYSWAGLTACHCQKWEVLPVSLLFSFPASCIPFLCTCCGCDLALAEPKALSTSKTPFTCQADFVLHCQRLDNSLTCWEETAFPFQQTVTQAKAMMQHPSHYILEKADFVFVTRSTELVSASNIFREFSEALTPSLSFR